MESIKQVLMRRDGMSEEQADNQIKAAKENLHDLLSRGEMSAAEYICEDWFGLEPDYMMELI